MRTITVKNTLGNDITVSLAEYVARWESVTDVQDLKSLAFNASAEQETYERLEQIEQELIDIREQLVLDAFNRIYKASK